MSYLYNVSGLWRMSPEGEPGEHPLPFDRWEQFVNDHLDLLTWHDDTPLGRLRVEVGNQDTKQYLLGHRVAEGEYSKKHDDYRVKFRNYGYEIRFQFFNMRPNKKWLLVGLELAEYLGVNLYVIPRKKPITREELETRIPT